MGFDFTSQERLALGHRLLDRIDQYFSTLPERPVQPPESVRATEHTPQEIPELGSDAGEVLDTLCREMIDQGFHIPAANYFGLMNPTPTYMAVLAEALVAALNPQLASLARSQFASRLEAETLHWIASQFGWHKATGAPSAAPGARLCEGTFTSGGNEANFSALALALTHRFPQVIDDGLAALGRRPVLYASAESHHSLEKSAGLLGLGRTVLRRIEVDDHLRINLTKLERHIERDRACGFEPFCVVATAGTTSSGAIDDLAALAVLAHRHGLWLHVDGAYGAAAAFSDRHRHLIAGIEDADSITIDPHKWLAMPFACGIVLTRHPELLERVFSVASPYLSQSPEALADNFRISAQWSRRMNSLKLWLTLRVHGRQAYAEMIDRQMELATKMRHWLEGSEHFELAAPQTLPILNFRLRGVSAAEAETAHQHFLEEFNRDGLYWISRTHVRGESVLRTMIISYLSGEKQLEGLQRALERAAVRSASPSL